MLWIRIGFNADSVQDSAFYLNANSDPDPGSQTMRIHADPDPGQFKNHKTLNFYMINIYKGDKDNTCTSINIPLNEGTQKPFESPKTRFIF